MSYEMKDILKTMIDNNEPHWTADTMDKVRAELEHVYAQAPKADELQKQIGILLGKLDTLKINLDYYKKKTDEYEAKAKAFDVLYAEFDSGDKDLNLSKADFDEALAYESGELDV